MISIDEITQIELELSSHCNASCPLCPRNLFGHNTELGYTKKHLSLPEVKQILSIDFLKQIERITFEGNFGDPLANPELLDIIKYINTETYIVTNGYFRSKQFWQNLAEHDVTVEFGIDGANQLTHSRYRRGTNLDKILLNAKTFIQAGGKAVWKMIKFDFNRDQIDRCKQLANELGFESFQLVDHGRNSGPVFDQSGKLVDVIGNFSGSLDFDHYKKLVESGEMLLEDIDQPVVNSVNCYAKKNKTIYISSTGEVYPCCYMGFNPGKYGNGRWHQPVNQQLIPLINENNALVYSLEHCIKWFNKITLNPGDLVVCDSSCGHNQR